MTLTKAQRAALPSVRPWASNLYPADQGQFTKRSARSQKSSIPVLGVDTISNPNLSSKTNNNNNNPSFNYNNNNHNNHLSLLPVVLLRRLFLPFPKPKTGLDTISMIFSDVTWMKSTPLPRKQENLCAASSESPA